MTMPKQKQIKSCKKCSEEYEATIVYMGGSEIVLGEGYCDSCNKARMEKDDLSEKMKENASIATKRRQWRTETVGIPIRFMSKDFSNYDPKFNSGKFGSEVSLKACQDYAEKFPLAGKIEYPSLMMMSPPTTDNPNAWGVGKTHLACSIAHRILDRWQGENIACPVRFVSEYDIYNQIQQTFSFGPEEAKYRESAQDIKNRYRACRLLVIDDIGKQERKDPTFVQGVLFEIIDGRYRNNLPVVITTNKNSAGLKQYLGNSGEEATYDRLAEMCEGHITKMEGKSYRKRGK